MLDMDRVVQGEIRARGLRPRGRAEHLDGRLDHLLLGLVGQLEPLRRHVHRQDLQGQDSQGEARENTKILLK